MKRLWTPWRMAYIKAPKDKHPAGCIFCAKIKASRENDRDNLVLFRGRHSFIALNLYPYTNGHIMVVPYQHTSDFESLDGATLKEMMLLVADSIRALRLVANPQGFNVGMNLGRVAGAGVEEHIHIHVVPRWNGDTDFMAVTADVRKIPEMLPETFDSLAEALKQIRRDARKKQHY